MISHQAVAAAMAKSTLPKATLVLGGARAGKSAYAETLIAAASGDGDRPVYIATGEARDGEMAERISAHRRRRGDAWKTVEAPLDLAKALASEIAADRPGVVDCLTLWLSNLLEARRDVAHETELLIAALAALRGKVVLVSNEVGLGIVPDNPLARAFRDHAGRMHQMVAAAVPRVVLVAAGLPLILKDAPGPTS